MMHFLKRNRHFLLLVCIFIIAELIVNPTGNFPLIDDWSFAQSVLFFRNTGSINIGNFPSMTLYTHILWGWLVTKIFGFSFVVLRASTLVSAIIGFAFLNKLVVQISATRSVGFISCLVLLFNPLVFNLSNTFMTDVNFNTLVIVGCYLGYNFFRSGYFSYYMFFLLCSMALTLLRQYGIIFPACFIIACFFMKENRIRNFILSILCFIAVYSTLKIYENYLAGVLPQGSEYRFSGNIRITARAFWETVFENFITRHKDLFIHLLMYTAPFAAIFLIGLLRQVNMRRIVLILAVNVILTCLLFYKSQEFSSGTIFFNMMIGPETFSETFKGARHNVYESFEHFSFVVKWIFCLMTLFILSLALISLRSKIRLKQFAKPELIFFPLIMLAYVFMLMITDSYFDRYYMPLITLAIILFAYLSKFFPVKTWPMAIPLLFWFYLSVFGTKDYLELHRQTWNAYWYLRNDLKVPKEQINGGFEVNCWNEGEGMGWRDFLDNSHFNYLIQFNPEEHFRPLKEYEFQRYFPYKKDKIYIFVKEPTGTR